MRWTAGLLVGQVKPTRGRKRQSLRPRANRVKGQREKAPCDCSSLRPCRPRLHVAPREPALVRVIRHVVRVEARERADVKIAEEHVVAGAVDVEPLDLAEERQRWPDGVVLV